MLKTSKMAGKTTKNVQKWRGKCQKIQVMWGVKGTPAQRTAVAMRRVAVRGSGSGSGSGCGWQWLAVAGWQWLGGSGF
jgi:hypothetical protein